MKKSPTVKSRSRKWRLLLNNDGGGDVFAHPKPITRPQLTDVIDPLSAGGVDTFVFGLHLGNSFLHDTKVGEILTEGPVAEKALDLISRGMDPVRILCEQAHRLKMKFIVSLRLNDVHDLWHTIPLSRMKREHPDMLIGEKGRPYDRPQRPYPNNHFYASSKHVNTVAWDYADPRVIRMRKDILAETVEKYDIDGLELDFLRHPVFFPLGEEHRHAGMMTGLVRDIRKMLITVGKERRKGMELGAIIPYAPELCEEIGLQIHDWLKEELLDYIVPRAMDGVTTEIPYDRWHGITRGSPVRIFGSVLETGSPGPILSDDVLAGLTSLYRYADLDGIYLFNFNYRPHPLADTDVRFLRKMSRPALLKNHDKIYLLAHHSDEFGAYRDRFQMPCPLEDEARVEFFLGEEFGTKRCSPPGWVTISILAKGCTPRDDEIVFTINGRMVRNNEIRVYEESVNLPKLGGWWWHEPEPMTVFDISAANIPLHPGKNIAGLKLRRRVPAAEEPIQIRDLIVTVSYQQKLRKIGEILGRGAS